MASPMTSPRRLVLACALILGSALAAGAQPAPPVLTAPVNDFAKKIDPASEQELQRLIRALQTATGDVVTVATVPTFQPYGDIKSYAVKMFENGGAGVGQRGKDNGVLVVVAGAGPEGGGGGGGNPPSGRGGGGGRGEGRGGA